jgi:hypothetical protein
MRLEVDELYSNEEVDVKAIKLFKETFELDLYYITVITSTQIYRYRIQFDTFLGLRHNQFVLLNEIDRLEGK